MQRVFMFLAPVETD